jgi:hypothetical protein
VGNYSQQDEAMIGRKKIVQGGGEGIAIKGQNN